MKKTWLETRFLTSENYNTHPLQIFFIRFRYYSIVILGGELFFQGEIWQAEFLSWICTLFEVSGNPQVLFPHWSLIRVFNLSRQPNFFHTKNTAPSFTWHIEGHYFEETLLVPAYIYSHIFKRRRLVNDESITIYFQQNLKHWQMQNVGICLECLILRKYLLRYYTY